MNYSILDYIIENYILIVAMVGLWLSTYMNINLTKYMIRLLRECVLIIFALSVIEYVEHYVTTFETLSWWRQFLTAMAYSINPLLIIQAARIMCGIRKYKLIVVPALINIAISFSVFFTDIAYYFTQDNKFHRGILGYSPYITSAFYVIVFFVMVTRCFKRNTITENIVIVFISFNALMGMLLRIVYDMTDIYNLLFIVDIVFYYMFLHIQYAKIDQLTGLMNRQSCYNDVYKFGEAITGIIEIDMNELKWINDSKGHLAGDEAIRVVSECFLDNVGRNNRVYRVGGDEFIIICMKQSEEDIRKDVARIRAALSKTEYSCAIGMAYRKEKEDVNDVLSLADEMMYEDKKRIKQAILDSGGVLHSRKMS